MKKYIIILILLFLGVSCYTITEQEEVTPNTDLRTKSIENPTKFPFTLTSNISENILINRVIINYPEYIEDYFTFSQRYQDSLYKDQGFLLLPDPVKGKVWTEIRGNNIMNYDTTTNNKFGAPYIEGYVDQSINIELIYRDSSSHSGNSSSGSNSGSIGTPEDEQEDEKYSVYRIHHYNIIPLPNNYYELTFKIQSGIYDSGGIVEINPLIGEEGIVVYYEYWGELRQYTTLEPHEDYFTLKLPASTGSRKIVYITIPNQRNTEKHWEIIGLTKQFNL